VTITDDLGIDDLFAELDISGRAAPVIDRLPPTAELADGTLTATQVRGTTERECRSTRAAMHDYLSRRLQPRRARRWEVHLDRCAECIRVFIDIREAGWTRRTTADSATLTVTRADTTDRLTGTS
jgi:hypothetical protein